MSIPHSLILGIVEGFTEFLPISSTAHLVLASDLLKIAQSDYVKTFEIAIQSGAILAVVILYWKKFLDFEVLKRIIVAFIPTAILGFIFYKAIKNYLIGSLGVILWSLALGGLFLVLFEYLFRNKDTIADIKEINYKKSLGIGLFQSVAMIPGISRAAATIIGGMLLRIKRETIVEFSFLLAVPTMLAATGLDLIRSFNEFSSSQFSVLGLGLIASFVMAIISIKFLLNYVKNHSFTAFGVYRIIIVFLMLVSIV